MIKLPMNYKFEYDHTRLSLPLLHRTGVRSTKQLEEVIEWGHSICMESKNFDFPLYRFIGLTFGCLGLEIAVTFDQKGRFVPLDVQISEREEFIMLMINNLK